MSLTSNKTHTMLYSTRIKTNKKMVDCCCVEAIGIGIRHIHVAAILEALGSNNKDTKIPDTRYLG